MRASLAVLVLCASSSFAADRTATPFDRSMLAGPLAVCVHLPGGYTEIQQGALLPLGIRKIRTDVFYDNPVTESGAQWNKQQDHWKGQIRKTMNEVKPERLYWYANWENQPPGKGDGWISIAEGGRVIPSPLYSQLLLSAEPQP